MNLPPNERTRQIERVDEALSPMLFGDLGFWRGLEGTGAGAIKRKLVEIQQAFRGVSEQALVDALLVVANFERLQTVAHVARAWNKLKLIVAGFPHSPAKLEVLNCDARGLPIPQAFVDLVITSPPYINVFNYHQQYRSSTEALGWNLLKVAKSEIGSNRKHRGNRFLTVIQYCLDITMALSELNRVCKPSAHLVFVVGRESTVRGVRFFNGEIVGRLASKCTSLRVDCRQERSFRNRFGNLIVEDLLHFSIVGSRKHSDLFNLADARDVAADILKHARATPTDASVIDDINEALVGIGEVQPSPMFIADMARAG